MPFSKCEFSWRLKHLMLQIIPDSDIQIWNLETPVFGEILPNWVKCVGLQVWALKERCIINSRSHPPWLTTSTDALDSLLKNCLAHSSYRKIKHKSEKFKDSFQMLIIPYFEVNVFKCYWLKNYSHQKKICICFLSPQQFQLQVEQS